MKTVVDQGTIYNYIDNKTGRMEVTRIHAAFRNLNSRDIGNIVVKNIKRQGVENDISTVMKTVRVNKNLLLFFPYIFHLKNNQYEKCSDKVILNIVCGALFADFHVAFKHRSKTTNNCHDTFFVFIYVNKFIICQVNNAQLLIIDIIEAKQLPTFMQLFTYSSFQLKTIMML